MPLDLPRFSGISVPALYPRVGGGPEKSRLGRILDIPCRALIGAGLDNSFKISIDDHELRYRTLFAGTRSIALSEIKKAETKVGVEDSFGPMYRLAVYPQRGLESRPIVINLKVFSKKDLKQLFALLAPKLR